MVESKATMESMEKQEQNTKEREQENENDQNLRHPFTTESRGYYLSVKREIDELFSKYPQDKTLCDAFTHSEWARIKGSEDAPQYLVGAVYEDGKVKYVCYALLAEDKDNPPSEIKEVCTFVPTSPLLNAQGFFVIFQSAATGECISPEKV